MLSAFLTEEIIRDKAKSQLSLAYFFCDDKDDRLRTADAILVNLLTQLLTHAPNIIVHFSVELEFATEKENTSWSYNMLWRVFKRILNDVSIGQVCLLIDALGIESYPHRDLYVAHYRR